MNANLGTPLAAISTESLTFSVAIPHVAAGDERSCQNRQPSPGRDGRILVVSQGKGKESTQ